MKNLITLELTAEEAAKLYRVFMKSVDTDNSITPLESKLWDSKNQAKNILNPQTI